MTFEYEIRWTDDQVGNNPLKPRFTVSPNEVNGPGNAAADTSLTLPGKFTPNYGQVLNSNYVHLMEHFSSPTEPANPTSGMIWFDSATNGGILKYRTLDNTSWVSITSKLETPRTISISGDATGSVSFDGSTDVDIVLDVNYESPWGVGGVGTLTLANNGSGVLPNLKYFVDTSNGSFSIPLPPSPTVGTYVGFTDVAGTFSTSPLTITGNGENILGSTAAMINNVSDASFVLAFSGTARGWVVVT